MANGESSRTALEPIISRLREIERKCASMSSRSEEFPQMQEKVAGIIARLEAGQEPSGQPLDFRSIARELFPVAHLFESTGFMSIGKEIAHVERSLAELAPETGDRSEPASSGPHRSIRTSSATARTDPEPKPEPELPSDEDPPHERWKVPFPVVVGTLMLALAVAVSATLILRAGPRAGDRRQPTPAPSTGPTELAATVPVRPSEIPRTPAAPEPSPARIQKARLAEAVAQARLALAKGDLEMAAERLSEAGLYDRTDDDVVEIADEVIRGFVGWGYGAANRADWTEAERYLERAERTAMRFGLSTAQVERAKIRIASMERFRIVGPGDRQVILGSTGRRVEVALSDGSVRAGRIEGIDAGMLVLNMDSKVGGGTVRFSEEIAFSDIESIKIFED